MRAFYLAFILIFYLPIAAPMLAQGAEFQGYSRGADLLEEKLQALLKKGGLGRDAQVLIVPRQASPRTQLQGFVENRLYALLAGQVRLLDRYQVEHREKEIQLMLERGREALVGTDKATSLLGARYFIWADIARRGPSRASVSLSLLDIKTGTLEAVEQMEVEASEVDFLPESTDPQGFLKRREAEQSVERQQTAAGWVIALGSATTIYGYVLDPCTGMEGYEATECREQNPNAQRPLYLGLGLLTAGLYYWRYLDEEKAKLSATSPQNFGLSWEPKQGLRLWARATF